MNRFNGFLSLVFVAAFGLVACNGDAAADEQKRKDDSLAAAIAHQDSLTKATTAPVDTTKKVESATTTPDAKTQAGTKTSTTGTKTNEVKTNTSGGATTTTSTTSTTSSTTTPATPADTKTDAQKGGGEKTPDAVKAGPTDPKKTTEKASKSGKQ